MIDPTVVAAAAKAAAARIASKIPEWLKKIFTDKEIARSNRATEKETERHHTTTEKETERHHTTTEELLSKEQGRKHMATLDKKRKDAILELGNENIQIRIQGVESLIEVAMSYADSTELNLNIEERGEKINDILQYLCQYIQTPPTPDINKIDDSPVRKKIFEKISNRLRLAIDNESNSVPPENPWSFIQCDFSNSTINYPLDDISLINAKFLNVDFKDGASFNGSSFYGTSIFNKAKFYCNAQFSGSNFYGPVTFIDSEFKTTKPDNISCYAAFSAQFHSDACFKNSTFECRAIFRKSHFHETADFTIAKFNDSSDFNWVTFEKFANFSGTEFKNDNTDFSNAKFNSLDTRAHFQGTKFGNDEGSAAVFRETDFKIAPYFDGASITGSGIFTANIHEIPEKIKNKKVDCAFKFMYLDYRGEHKFDFYELGSYKYVPGKATIVLKDGQSITHEIPAGSRLFDPTSWNERTYMYTCVSDFAKPLENSDTEEENPTE